MFQQFLYNKFVFIVTLLGALFLSGTARAWIEPGGPDPQTASLSTLNTHGRLTVDAIGLLRADGYVADADACDRYLQQLINGARAADTGGGEFNVNVHIDKLSIFRGTFAKNSMQHFYNWGGTKNNGLRGLYISHINKYFNPVLLRSFGGSFDIELLRGPHPDAASVADWHYACAVQAMRNNDPEAAYFELGYTLHLLQDLFVPQHARNEILAGHERFELEANKLLLDNKLPPVPEDIHGDYHDDMLASEYIKLAAEQSYDEFDNARSKKAARRLIAISSMMLQARRLSAGLLHKFQTRWNTEPYSMVQLTINRVQALRNFEAREAESFGEADFKAFVSLKSEDSQRWFSPHKEARAAKLPMIYSSNNCSPNGLGPLWMIPGYLGKETAVRIDISIFDDDTRARISDDHADINSSKDTQDLNLLYNLETKSIVNAVDLPGLASAPAHFISRGDDCLVDFSIESIYLPEMKPITP